MDREGDACEMRRISRKTCMLAENDEHKPVMRCEKVEQVLKQCMGRPAEVVESHKEVTEEPVDEVIQAPHSQDEENPFLRIPGFVEGQLSAGIENFIEAAEDMANELFGQFGFQRRKDDAPPSFPFPGDRGGSSGFPPFGRPNRGEPSKPPQEDESLYADFSRGFEEV